jgi:TIGR03009 family protein
MISRAFASAALLFVASFAVAQVQPGTPAPAANPVDRHLKNLESRMKAMDSFIAKLERRETAKDGSIRVLMGEARYLKPNCAALQMVRQDNPKLFEMYILSGPNFYEYRAQTKEIWYRKMESGDSKIQTNILSLLSGITAEKARQDFDWKLIREDEKVIHITLEPKPASGRREFIKADLVLVTESMLPQQVRLEQINGNIVDWKITSMDTRTPLKVGDFAPPQPPGWKLIEAPKAPAAPPGNRPPG